mmetsp:Transcript_3679/g.3202  ORF Transcript_3679/g.3202 Transcript_3679/m.3202 type:complete len:181 (-) Transcript_3679:47-589(-)
MKKSDIQEEITPVKTKEIRREKNREKHAIKAANLEMNIEKEILNRANEGLFGEHEILNINRNLFKQKVNEGEYGDEESLNESMDSQLTGDVAMGMDLEDIGHDGGEKIIVEEEGYNGLNKSVKAGEEENKDNLDIDKKPKTKIATRLKTLKKMNGQIKRKRDYQFEKEDEKSFSNKLNIF